MQCRVLGTCVFGAAGLHSGLEAYRALPRSGNRTFFGLASWLLEDFSTLFSPKSSCFPSDLCPFFSYFYHLREDLS